MNVLPEIVTSASPSVMNRTTSRSPKATTGGSPAPVSNPVSNPVSKWNCDWWIEPSSGPMTVQ